MRHFLSISSPGRVPVALLWAVVAALAAGGPRPAAGGAARPRAREIGIVPGMLQTGPLNAITDVEGVAIGHATAIEGERIRTGVTAIVPHSGDLFVSRVPAALHVGNGFGKLIGATQLSELGELETPLLLTSTLGVWQAAGALAEWMLARPGMERVKSINPVVGETNDGYLLNDYAARPDYGRLAIAALEAAAGGPVAEGSVGAGTGTIAFGWKGGIGTSSRVVPGGPWTVGVLVQSNFGGDLLVLGVPVGRELGRIGVERGGAEGDDAGSIMIVVATDAPLSERNLERLAGRAMLGLARAGSFAGNGSGDYVVAFSTAAEVRREHGLERLPGEQLPNDSMTPLFQAVVEATEEAVYNSLLRATTVSGCGNTARAIPIDELERILARHGRIGAKDALPRDAAGAVPDSARRGAQQALESIDPLHVYSLCRELAAPKYAGRLTGHAGYTAAARRAAALLEEWGLEPVPGTDGYLQAFPCPYTIVRSAELTIVRRASGGGDSSVVLAAPDDFLPMLFSDGGDVTAELVFAGWGIGAPELGYDDYAGIDVEGRLVVCFRGTPDRERREFEEHDHHRRRMEAARELGAAGLFYIYDEPIANPNGDLLDGFLCGVISEAVADALLEEHGTSSEKLRRELLDEGRPRSFPLGSRAHYKVSVEHHPDGTGYNVLAMLRGSDPALAGSAVVLGAHLDHCGEHMGIIFPGAQDNASGSAVVLEIARAFSRLGVPPARTVIFVLFGAEEMGLLGSSSGADFLARRFDALDAMFNFDMVGQGDRTNCGVTPDPPGLRAAIEAADARVGTLGRMWEIRRVGVRSSDYAPFFHLGVPCASFHSNGPHLHYHRPGDTIHRINPDMLADVARLGFAASLRRAERDEHSP